MSQENKVCGFCKELGHSKFYCKKRPAKTPKRTAIKTTIKKTVPNKPKKRTESRSKLVKKLDSIFSQYIRLRDDNKGCVTCGDIKPWKEMQNCHFYTRGRQPTRWDETNCHSGCYRCNVILKGNYIKYTIYMMDRYGREVVDGLERKSLSGVKISTPELREMIEEYKIKVKELTDGRK